MWHCSRVYRMLASCHVIIKRQMHSHPCTEYVQIFRADFPECDSINQHLNVTECSRNSSQRVILCHSGWRVRFRFYSGGALRANNFYSLWLQFFLWFRAIFRQVPTHLTTGQLKILPLPWKNRRLAGAKHNRNSVTAGPTQIKYTASPLTSSLLPRSCLRICCYWTAHSVWMLFKVGGCCWPKLCSATHLQKNTEATVDLSWVTVRKRKHCLLHMNGVSCGCTITTNIFCYNVLFFHCNHLQFGFFFFIKNVAYHWASKQPGHSSG